MKGCASSWIGCGPERVTKDAALIDVWSKELTPSIELRKWFHEDKSRQVEFEQRYRAELDKRAVEIELLLASLREQLTITLVTATKDLQAGHSAILLRFLRERL